MSQHDEQSNGPSVQADAAPSFTEAEVVGHTAVEAEVVGHTAVKETSKKRKPKGE